MTVLRKKIDAFGHGWLAVVLLALLVSACGTVDRGVPSAGERRTGTFKPYTINGVTYTPLLTARGYNEKGVASWYGPQFHGRPTANGERFDMYAISAAHPLLPLPTMARVTNLENGRQILVRVNDRGPFHKGRLLDLSYGSAKALGVAGNGTALVRVEVMEEDNPVGGDTFASVAPEGAIAHQAATKVGKPLPGMPPPGRSPKLFVQVGAFQSYPNAERLAGKLKELGKTHIQSSAAADKTIYRVRLGPLASVERADEVVERLTGLGIQEGRVVVE